MTYVELGYDVAVSSDRERQRRHLDMLVEDILVAPFNHSAGARYGPVRLAMWERKTDHLDTLTAAYATALGVTLVTNNTKGFIPCTGHAVESWFDF